jgi:hypothetical protein
MPVLTAAQIVTKACQIAKTPGFTLQGGDYLNLVLDNLCQDYDLELARGFTTFNLGATVGTYPSIPAGSLSGPYPMPTDYLRARKGDVFYTYQGVPYFMTPIDLSEFDRLVQQQGFNDFPRDFTTDMALSPPVMLVWPPPSLVAPTTVRYYKQMPTIVNPSTSSTVPWFPNQLYLITATAGLLMMDASDTRWQEYLSDDEDRYPMGAGSQLRRYLKMKDDPEGKTDMVTLDRRRFGVQFNRLPNTKLIGW